MYGVATVLTDCGIETYMSPAKKAMNKYIVATVLTDCGIETHKFDDFN